MMDDVDNLPWPLRRKIFSRDTARDEFGPRRADRLVFTNGCFDLLHRGHVELFAAARAHGDRLVVGLNSDDSVRRIKGPLRPLMTEIDRAAVLAGLESLDGVILFEEDTPEELINELQPDVLVKGGDYTPDQVVGRAIVEARGGSVVIFPYLEGHSTSSIADRAARFSSESS